MRRALLPIRCHLAGRTPLPRASAARRSPICARQWTAVALARPFVGPAGRLLDAALEKAGVDRSDVFVTNAVKHFSWFPRGKRRMHKTPAQSEVPASLHC